MDQPGRWEYEHATIAWEQTPDGLGSTYRRPWRTTITLAGRAELIPGPEVADGQPRTASLVAALNHLGGLGWEVEHVEGWGEYGTTAGAWSALLRRARPTS